MTWIYASCGNFSGFFSSHSPVDFFSDVSFLLDIVAHSPVHFSTSTGKLCVAGTAPEDLSLEFIG